MDSHVGGCGNGFSDGADHGHWFVKPKWNLEAKANSFFIMPFSYWSEHACHFTPLTIRHILKVS